MLCGFYFDFEKNVFGLFVEMNEELMSEFEKMFENLFKIEDSFLEQFCIWEDGYVVEKIVKIVFVEKQVVGILKEVVIYIYMFVVKIIGCLVRIFLVK